MNCVVTGAAGFIGSHLVDRLLKDGHSVTGVDNFSTGRVEFLKHAQTHPKFKLHKADLLDEAALDPVLAGGIDWVFHLAANADVAQGLKQPRKDLEQNTIVTWNILEAMRRGGVRQIAFSSTGSIYGEAEVVPTPETAPFPVQTSLYGASKLAGEGLISAYAEGYDFRALIFRFVSILGERYTHGHVVDFVRQLEAHPESLRVLGNGKQTKSYLYISDCLDAIMTALRAPQIKHTEIFNLGTDEHVQVIDSIHEICDELGIRPKIDYTGGQRGWIGDNPFIFLDCQKIRKLGWAPKKSIRESVRLTVRYLKSNPWVLSAVKQPA